MAQSLAALCSNSKEKLKKRKLYIYKKKYMVNIVLSSEFAISMLCVNEFVRHKRRLRTNIAMAQKKTINQSIKTTQQNKCLYRKTFASSITMTMSALSAPASSTSAFARRRCRTIYIHRINSDTKRKQKFNHTRRTKTTTTTCYVRNRFHKRVAARRVVQLLRAPWPSPRRAPPSLQIERSSTEHTEKK